MGYRYSATTIASFYAHSSQHDIWGNNGKLCRPEQREQGGRGTVTITLYDVWSLFLITN